MPSLKSALAATVITLFATGNAHMLMASPPSYGKPDKSPLAADGSDFPCKATSTGGAPVTDMAIGQQQTLSFNGTAVHGGGSCQVSLTTDSPATKGSKWIVVHSIEGGCPARNQAGNLPDGADPDTTPDPDTYKYSIPSGIAPGAYTLAWTWFNKVGNREMYMNCASIKVTGGSSKRDDTHTSLNETETYLIPEQLSERDTTSFPSMFVANIGNGCTTADGGDLKFPDPGASVETNQGNTFLAPVGNCAAAAGSSSSASSGNTQAGPSAASPMAAAAPSAPPAAAAAPSVASPAPAPAPSSSSTASTGGSGSSTSSCSTPGQSICSPDGTQVGTCAQSNTVTWTKVAEGTKCEGGNVVAATAKRSVKFLDGYFERV